MIIIENAHGIICSGLDLPIGDFERQATAIAEEHGDPTVRAEQE